MTEKSRSWKFLNHFQLEFGEEDGKRNNNIIVMMIFIPDNN